MTHFEKGIYSQMRRGNMSIKPGPGGLWIFIRRLVRGFNAPTGGIFKLNVTNKVVL